MAIDYMEKPNTVEKYLHYIRHYCKFLNKTPTQIIDEANRDIKSGLLMNEIHVFDDLPAFNNHLKVTASTNTRAWKIAAVKSFYRKFEIQLLASNSINRIEIVPIDANEKRARKELIQEALKVCNVFERAVAMKNCSMI